LLGGGVTAKEGKEGGGVVEVVLEWGGVNMRHVVARKQ